MHMSMAQRIGRALVALVAALAIPATMLVASPPASAHSAALNNTPIGDFINHVPNGPCVGVVNGNPETEPCNGGLQQDWEFVSVPNHPRDALFRNRNLGGCLSILHNSTAEGAEVNLQTCNFSGGDAFELWTALTNQPGQPSGTQELINEGDGGLAMHPSGCGTGPGLRLFVNDRNQCPEDYWYLFDS